MLRVVVPAVRRDLRVGKDHALIRQRLPHIREELQAQRGERRDQFFVYCHGALLFRWILSSIWAWRSSMSSMLMTS